MFYVGSFFTSLCYDVCVGVCYVCRSCIMALFVLRVR